MGTSIQDAYNSGDFINLDMQQLVKDYVLSLKEGHTRAYSAIVSLEALTTDYETRITSLENPVDNSVQRSDTVAVKVEQLTHGFTDLDPVCFSGSSFVRAGSTTACDGIVQKLDDNNFNLIVKGTMLLPVTVNDDLDNPFVAGEWYFLSATLGKYSRSKPLTGIFQSVFRVYTDKDTVKHVLIDIGQPYGLTVSPKTSFTDGVGFHGAGNFDWTVPDNIYKIKVTCAGAGGGGGAYGNGDGGLSKISKNGSEECSATGGKKGIMDWQNVNAPAHGVGNGGTLNIKGGGSHGGIGVHREHRGDNDNIGSAGTNGGLTIKYINVVPQDTINCVVGAGGIRGMEPGDSENGIPDLYSQAGTDGYIFIEY